MALLFAFISYDRCHAFLSNYKMSHCHEKLKERNSLTNFPNKYFSLQTARCQFVWSLKNRSLRVPEVQDILPCLSSTPVHASLMSFFFRLFKPPQNSPQSSSVLLPILLVFPCFRNLTRLRPVWFQRLWLLVFLSYLFYHLHFLYHFLTLSFSFVSSMSSSFLRMGG